MYLVGFGNPEDEHYLDEVYDNLDQALNAIRYSIELEDVGTKFSIECFMGRWVNPEPHRKTFPPEFSALWKSIRPCLMKIMVKKPTRPLANSIMR